MSDPFSDPDARPWTSSGEPIVPSQPSSGFGAPDAPPQPPPAFGQPRGADGWSQPPSAPPPPQWGAPAGDQAQWGPPPQAGPPGGQPWGQPGAQQWGQAPYGQPPQKSSSSKVILIVVAVLVVLLAVPAVVAVILFRVGSTTVGEVIEQVEGFDTDSGAGVPDGPRLLETSGSVGQGGSQPFPFTVPDRTSVQIDVIGLGGFDPVAVLLDPGGRELTEDDDGGADRDSRITTELSSGTYTVEVRGFAGADGEFQVIVTDR